MILKSFNPLKYKGGILLFKLISKTLISCSIFYTCLNPYTTIFAKNLDINKDGVINSSDLDTLSIYFYSDNIMYDLNNDRIVDALDLAILAKNITTYEEEDQIIEAYDKDGKLLKSFSNHNLINAISLASQNNGVVKYNDNIIWNNTKYFIYGSNEAIMNYNSIRDAVKNAESLDNSIVVSKNGNIIYNKKLNFRKILGVTNTTVNLRSEPNMGARTDLTIPEGTLVEVSNIERGFYKISYYAKNNKHHIGYVPNYLDIIQDDINNSQLGYISAREESNGNPGIVSQNPNDKGGASFGVWQLSSKMGSVDAFLEFIKDKNPRIYYQLIDAKDKDGGEFDENFINEWKKVADHYYDDFYELQRKFIKDDYYDTVIKMARKNNINLEPFLDFNSTSNMIWSTSVQHGPGGTINILKKISLNSPIEDIISNIYEERIKIIAKSYPPDSPNLGVVALYNGIKNRLENEKEEIIRIYQRELNY